LEVQMNKTFVGLGLLLSGFVLASCASEEGKPSVKEKEKTNIEAVEASKSDNKTTSEKNGEEKVYSFEEFVKMTEQEQREFLIPMVNKLGYKDELSDTLLRFINEEGSDLPEHFTSVNHYVTYYAEVSDIPSLKLESESEDKGYTLPENITLSEEVIKQRIDALEGKTLFEINESDQLMVLGIGLGDSFSEVVANFGEPDHTGSVKESGISHGVYHYHIPGNTLKDGLNRYQFIFRYEDNGETADAISSIKLIMDNKDEAAPGLVVPSEFTDRFQGDVFVHSPTDFVFTNASKNFTMNFLHNTGVTQTLEVLSKGKDFEIEASVWGYDELQIFESNKSIYQTISLEEARKIMLFEDLKEE
jgi:hypothetical protein